MPEPKSPDRDQALYKKSEYLREYSSALLREAQELCHTSAQLRKTNTALANELLQIRTLVVVSMPWRNNDRPRVAILS
jgi:hypothetical protein